MADKAAESVIINIQGLVRKLLGAGKTDDEIRAAADGYKVGARMHKVSMREAIDAKLADWSPEEQEAARKLLAKLGIS
jgi:hypothetical protein